MIRYSGMLLLLSACSPDPSEKAESNAIDSPAPVARPGTTIRNASIAHPGGNAVAAPPEKIGGAYMDKNGTITLRLRTEDSRGIWEAEYIYRKTDKDYRQRLEEIGPLKPGQGKEVFARPE